MCYWQVERRQAEGQLDLGRAFDLVAAIGHADVNAMAGAILKTAGAAASIAQRTVFAYEFGNRPRTVAVADRRDGRFLQDIADSYARHCHYYALDGIAYAAKHYSLNGQPAQGASPVMLARLRRHGPQLSKRELDVLRGVLEGLTAVEIAESMGVQPSSVITYQKRAYKCLGISSQRQLFALCLSPHAA
ncbi:helix-turn-helix transcriptional regulator [Janthinobacterium sp. GB4P2]|uniref:helix-turn-helix transcriptional regulator n=1 Tax=Janthinobacterium sp. GB4P2 TaxID=3424189 RepID=UPI003F265284